MSKRKIKLGVQQLRAGFVPSTFNEERNTIDVVWTTGSRVKRYPWFGEPYMEELSLKKSHVDLERLNNGAPLLNNHNSRDLSDVIGVVETASLKTEDGQRVGTATVRLSEREELSGVVGDIKNGIIRNISVGYRINKFEELKERDDDLPVFRAIDWTPMELSFVGIPADAGAQSRNDDSTTNECEIINNEGENSMKKKGKANLQSDDQVRDGVPVAVDEEAQEQTSEETSESPKTEDVSKEDEKDESSESSKSDESSDAPKEDESEESEKEDESEESEKDESAGDESSDVRKLEMQRGLDIRNAVKVANLDEAIATDLIEKNVSIEEARKVIFKEMETRTSTKTVNTRIEVKDMEQKQARREAAVRGIMNAVDPTKKLQSGDEQFRHQSINQTARNFLAAEGHNTSTMSNLEVAQRALHTSSDFKAVLDDSCNKMLIEGYEEVPSTFELFTRSKIANDFKEITGYRLTTGGVLETVNEHGEYPRGSVSEKSEKYKVKKHGEIIGNTYEMLVNDDLGAFTDIPRQLGQKARRTENETFWALITGNQVMGDGQNLFSAAHSNVAAGSAISIASLGEMRKLLRRQLDEGKKRLNLMGKYLVVPAELETLADQFLSQIVPNNAGQANPFSGSLQKVVEPILDDSDAAIWFMFGSLAQGPMAEISRLGGALPEIFTRESFDVDGMEMKIRHTFGMRIMDHRQFVQNPGA